MWWSDAGATKSKGHTWHGLNIPTVTCQESMEFVWRSLQRSDLWNGRSLVTGLRIIRTQNGWPRRSEACWPELARYFNSQNILRLIYIYIYSGIMHAFRPRVRLFASVFACLLHQLQVILKKASKRPMSPEPRYAKMLSTNIQQEQKRADRSPSKVHLRSRTSHICFFLESRCPGPRYQIGWRY